MHIKEEPNDICQSCWQWYCHTSDEVESECPDCKLLRKLMRRLREEQKQRKQDE